MANYGSNSVSVLLGNGDGTFQTAHNFPAGSHPSSVAVGDFDGDGTPDLVVANEGSYPSYTDSSVSVLLGNGDGTFQTARNFPAGRGPRSVAVGDFDGDGLLDLAVAGFYCPYECYDHTLRVLLGNGDGTFQTARNFLAGSGPYSVAVGDFDGDGRLDLAVANYLSSNVSVLLGNGDGSFQTARNFPAAGRPNSVAVGDFNGDGLLDLVVTSGTVRVLLGNGDGTFQRSPVSYVAGNNPRSVAVGDFNGDGCPDLAVANSGSNDVSILDNDCNWPLSPGRAPVPGARKGSQSHPADFWSLTAASMPAYPNWLPSSILPSAVTPKEPLTPPGLVDTLFAAPTRAVAALPSSEVLRLGCRGLLDRHWRPLKTKLELLEQAVAVLAWEEA